MRKRRMKSEKRKRELIGDDEESLINLERK